MRKAGEVGEEASAPPKQFVFPMSKAERGRALDHRTREGGPGSRFVCWDANTHMGCPRDANCAWSHAALGSPGTLDYSVRMVLARGGGHVKGPQLSLAQAKEEIKRIREKEGQKGDEPKAEAAAKAEKESGAPLEKLDLPMSKDEMQRALKHRTREGGAGSRFLCWDANTHLGCSRKHGKHGGRNGRNACAWSHAALGSPATLDYSVRMVLARGGGHVSGPQLSLAQAREEIKQIREKEEHERGEHKAQAATQAGAGTAAGAAAAASAPGVTKRAGEIWSEGALEAPEEGAGQEPAPACNGSPWEHSGRELGTARSWCRAPHTQEGSFCTAC